jgi:hypothetical protein
LSAQSIQSDGELQHLGVSFDEHRVMASMVPPDPWICIQPHHLIPWRGDIARAQVRHCVTLMPLES